MGGGYVSCGEFMGDDKSCSAFAGVLEQVVSLPSYRPDAELLAFVERMRNLLAGQDDPEWSDFLIIPPQHAVALEPYLKACRDSLVADLNTEDPLEAIEQEEAESALDPVEAKWGKSKGWRLLCIHDLLLAVAHSQETGEEICISFD